MQSEKIRVITERTPYSERLSISTKSEVNPKKIITSIVRYLSNRLGQELRHAEDTSLPEIEMRLLGYTREMLNGVTGRKETTGYIHLGEKPTTRSALMLTGTLEKTFVRLSIYGRQELGNKVEIYPITKDYIELLKEFTKEETYRKYLEI